MKTKIALALLVISMISYGLDGFGQNLYPIQGPLAAQVPTPVFKGQIRRPMFSAGPPFLLLKSWTLTNGEVVTLQGKVTVAKASPPNIKALGDRSSYPPQPNLAFAWDAVYGEKYYVSRILGRNLYQAVFIDKLGTVLQAESLGYRFGVPTGDGVAVDNNGNIYKIVW